METSDDVIGKIPEDLKSCVKFHGHLCPGLIYGYLVSKEAQKKLNLKRSTDEEVVTITENDSCAVDAFQVILGCTKGKGNLFFKDYGKNAYTVISRSSQKAFRFYRKSEFEMLDEKISEGTADAGEIHLQKMMKSMDLLLQPFENIFHTSEVPVDMPPYAELARSKACSGCGEMTMETKMIPDNKGDLFCIPCSEKGIIKVI